MNGPHSHAHRWVDFDFPRNDGSVTHRCPACGDKQEKPARPAGTRTATVPVTATYPEGMYADLAAVVDGVLTDPQYGLTADRVQVKMSDAPVPRVPALPFRAAERDSAAAEIRKTLTDPYTKATVL